MTARTRPTLIVFLGLCSSVFGGVFDTGFDGSDGAFSSTENVEVDLGLAASLCDCDGDAQLDDPCRWDCRSPEAGKGVYDAKQWAVVFHYTTVTIPPGVTVTFTNHPSGAPVVWLANDHVTINGVVDVSGENGGTSTVPAFYAQPGPGGFEGGIRANSSPLQLASAGFGPGGGRGLGNAIGRGGSYATVGFNQVAATIYGNEEILPLIGGSGENGRSNPGGGSGGGAILIASSKKIDVNAGASIIAYGGVGAGNNYHASGGAIRLVAPRLAGGGALRALGRSGGTVTVVGNGRIRVDADDLDDLTDRGLPNWTTSHSVVPIFPPDNAPTLRATLVDRQSIPSDPRAGVATADVVMNNGGEVELKIEATAIPTTATVKVRVVPARGVDNEYTLPPNALQDCGNGILCITARVTFPPGKSEVQLRANWTP